MLKQYLEEATYAYAIHAEFTKDTLKHVVASEFNPSGGESGLFILFQEGNKIYNENGTFCANIVNGKIELVE